MPSLEKADQTLLHVTPLQVLEHNSMPYWLFESVGDKETLPCLPVGPVLFTLPSEVEE
jgi:hypothetical protein